MAAPRQMTQFTLNALKGWPAPAAVDFNTTYDPTVVSQGAVVLAGSVCHLSHAGQYLLGVGSMKAMPLFMFNSSDDPDVVNDGGDASVTRGVFVPINPTGQSMALVAVGAYELVSTAFYPDTYLPNDHLTSKLSPDVTAGQLRKGTLWTDTIVGIVSRGVVDNGYGFDALAFWPYYIPPDAAHAVPA
jgi:hypothetical protein